MCMCMSFKKFIKWTLLHCVLYVNSNVHTIFLSPDVWCKKGCCFMKILKTARGLKLYVNIYNFIKTLKQYYIFFIWYIRFVSVVNLPSIAFCQVFLNRLTTQITVVVENNSRYSIKTRILWKKSNKNSMT